MGIWRIVIAVGVGCLSLIFIIVAVDSSEPTSRQAVSTAIIGALLSAILIALLLPA
jgi:hypothetical protein